MPKPRLRLRSIAETSKRRELAFDEAVKVPLGALRETLAFTKLLGKQQIYCIVATSP